MKILPPDEAGKITPGGGGRSSKIRAMLAQLKPGEALVISREDWRPKKRAPYSIINRYAKKSGRTFEKDRMADGSGWWARRIS